MDSIMYFIPLVLFAVAGFVVYSTKSRAKNISPDVLQQKMEEYVRGELSPQQVKGLRFFDLHEDAISSDHQWLCAYNENGMYLFPVLFNPYTRSMTKYEDETPMFNWKKRLGDTIYGTDKTEDMLYVPFAAVSAIQVNEDKGTFAMLVDGDTMSFKFYEKDGFWAKRVEGLQEFLQFLRNIKK